MGIFDRFPYSSTHEMNLDFMLGKATEIAESLQEIDTHKEQAEQAATNAAQSAQSAAQAAQAAAGSQAAAGTSASQAAQHKADAEDAADRAEAASDLADEAVEHAQTAATTAGTAAQNASTAADGAIASAAAAETRINNLAASLPEDFTELNNEVNDLKSAIDSMPPVKESTKTGVDLDIADPDGNVLMRINNGIFCIKGATIGVHVITVKADGTGDFASLRAAVESITDADSETNPYIIEIYPGTYNVLGYYTQSEISASGFVGLMIGDGISIVGIGNRDDIIIHGELSTTDYDSNKRNDISTLNFNGTSTLENVTVTAKYLRYCVHDDFTSAKTYFTRKVKNCKFRIYSATSGTQQKTWGEGSRPGKTTILEDCDFGTCMLWHSDNQYAATLPTKLIVKNCTATLALINCNNHNVLHQVYLYGNNFGIVSHSFDDISTNSMMMRVNGTGKGAMTNAPSTFNYTNGDIVRFRNNGSLSLAVGQLVIPSATPYWVSGTLSAVTDPEIAYGVIVGIDDDWFYVQTDGYINADRFGFSGLAIGDKITATTNGSLEVNGTGAIYGIVCCVTTLYGTYMRRIA